MPTTGYSRTPKLLKGALIYFGAPMLIPIPNIIIFQYNPESMTRTLTPWQPLKPPKRDREGKIKSEAEQKDYEEQRENLAQPYDPQETFSLALEIDATDALEFPESHPVASLTGIADRLAAIEMLMYPPGDSLLGGLLGSVTGSISIGGGGVSLGGAANVAAEVKRKEAPIVLFFWGPGRIVPVRITSLTIEEQQFSPLLYPLRAKATIGLRVLDLDDLVTVEGDKATGAAVEIAKGCYTFTRAQKEALALANLANSVESIIGMLPIYGETAMFDPKSRYAALTPVHVQDGRGRTVDAIPPAPQPRQTLRGIHLRKQNERPDHLAALYLGDPAGFWRLAEMNDAMTAEVVSEQREIAVPNPRIEREP